MKRVFILAVLTACCLGAAPSEVRAANSPIGPLATCGGISSQVFAGGYVVNRTCDGSNISGFGTTLDDAVSNVNEFSKLLDQGLSCSYGSFQATPGAFNTNFNCSLKNAGGGLGRSGQIAGIGTTATDAGNNVLDFAKLYAASSGYQCSSAQIQLLNGGFITDFSCAYPNTGGGLGRSDTISGIGSTSTEAAQNARGFAELAASVKRVCRTTSGSIRLNGVIFEVTFTCSNTGRAVVGYGSTLTSAGRDALMQAQSQ
ncbi:hypothetical protein [uncultured Xanthomonas sp.]|uniref:hypothetical protein n=1 Tax=uncultured Xanthomonas sp. TaxID=152831 RepID=UPI0025FBC6D4|nr:hypothetical protein [uncultured Xanthomonas sp.]